MASLNAGKSNPTATTTITANESSPIISVAMSLPTVAASSGGEKAKGRGKIQMRRMEKESNMLVTFSKRKSGLFKKANELCTLCGVQASVLIFSPAGKVFSFGHPSVDDVVDGYLNGNPIVQPGGADRLDNMEDSNTELAHLLAALEASKKRGKMLDERREERLVSCWWERPFQELNGHQKETLKHSLKGLNSDVSNLAKLRLFAASASHRPSSIPCHNIILGAGGPLSGGFPRWNNSNRAPGTSGHAHATACRRTL